MAIVSSNDVFQTLDQYLQGVHNATEYIKDAMKNGFHFYHLLFTNTFYIGSRNETFMEWALAGLAVFAIVLLLVFTAIFWEHL